MEKIDLLDFYVNYSGAGNINSNLWIIGVEPGGKYKGKIIENYTSIKEFEKSNLCIKDDLSGERSQYYKRVDEIVKSLCENKSIIKDNKVNIDEETNFCFVTNLFPLNFKGIDGKEGLNDYNKNFGTNYKGKNEYYEDIEKSFNERFKVFENALKNGGEKTIICIGKGVEYKYRKFFSGNWEKMESDNPKVMYYKYEDPKGKKHHLFVIHHLSWHKPEVIHIKKLRDENL